MNSILQKISADTFMEDLNDIIEEKESEKSHVHNIGITKAIILGGLGILPIAIIKHRKIFPKLFKI